MLITCGDDGLIELLFDSSETVARLQGRLAQVLRKQEKGSRPLLPNTTETLEQTSNVLHRSDSSHTRLTQSICTKVYRIVATYVVYL